MGFSAETFNDLNDFSGDVFNFRIIIWRLDVFGANRCDNEFVCLFFNLFHLFCLLSWLAFRSFCHCHSSLVRSCLSQLIKH